MPDNTQDKPEDKPAKINKPTPIGPSHQLAAPARPRHKVRWIVIWVLVLLALVVAGVLIWRSHEATEKAAAAARKPKPGISITTATAQKGNIGVYLDSIGTVTPVFTDSITSQVTGLVVAVHYQEGQLIAKGDPLVDIDPRPYRATLLQAEGALERDQNVLAQAKMDLERYRDAWARNAIAKQILDDQEKLVLQDEGTVKNDQGTVQYDQVQVDFCHITAPIAGRVGLRLVDPGNIVQAEGTVTLAVIAQLQPTTVIFTVPEDNLAQVEARLRQGAKLTVDAYDRAALKKIASGVLLTLDNQINTTTGTVMGRAQFDNKNDALFPNQFVNTRLLVNTLQGVTLIPASTMQQNGQASFVYVIQGNYAHMRSVKPGVTDGGTTQVDGLNPGEVVANSSFDKLQDKVAVVVANNAAPGNAKASDSKASNAKGTKPKGSKTK
jgi:multidrug efflux system membrane fusion protein